MIQQTFTAMTSEQKACVPLLLIWPFAAYLAASRLPPDLALFPAIFVYLVIGNWTGCLKPCRGAVVGALLGVVVAVFISISVSPREQFRSAAESQNLELACLVTTFAALGMLYGVVRQVAYPGRSNEHRVN